MTDPQGSAQATPPTPKTWRQRLLAAGRTAGAFLRAACTGFLLWLGEAVIGVLPLAAVQLVSRFNGTPVADPIAEKCILAVVIAGLSLLSLFRFGPHGRRHRVSVFAYLLALVALLTLLAGGIMYGLAVTEAAKGDTDLASFNLKVALAASLLLALEAAILDL